MNLVKLEDVLNRYTEAITAQVYASRLQSQGMNSVDEHIRAIDARIIYETAVKEFDDQLKSLLGSL